ncbi:MAG: hypothetical protein C4343_06310 [Chloroflexota bacterium]
MVEKVRFEAASKGLFDPEEVALRSRLRGTRPLGLGLLGGLAAAGTGLLDWTATIPGTPRRARVTRHLVVQAAALACFGVSFVLRLVGDPIRPSDLALVVAVAGTALLLVGNHLGGLLVYRDGMGVRIGR